MNGMQEGSVPIIGSRLLASVPDLVIGFSTRQGGVSPPPFGLNLSFRVGDEDALVARNRKLFFGALGIDEESVAIPRQVHGNTIRFVSAGGVYDDCDALATDHKNVFLGITAADCVPMFLAERNGGAVAAIHAGWRGTAARIAETAVQRIAGAFAFDPKDLVAYIAPCASACCYVVGEEVAEQFESHLYHKEGNRTYLDLKKANVGQLIASGIPIENIEVSPFCTIMDEEQFHSHRRDGVSSGRMMGVIGIRRPK